MTGQNDLPIVMIVAHADGACSGNPGPGGWAWRIELFHEGGGSQILEGCGGRRATTNNAMELTAAAEAMTALDAALEERGVSGVEAVFALDAEYVVRGLNEWLAGWKARGWRKADKKPVANAELWQALDAAHQLLSRRAEVRIEWVRGHNGDPGNEHVDRVAADMAQKIRAGLLPADDDANPQPAPQAAAHASPEDELAAALGAARAHLTGAPAPARPASSAAPAAAPGDDALDLLAAALQVLNAAERAPIHGRWSERYPDSYALAAAIEARLRRG